MMRDNHVHTNHNHYTITLETTHDQKPCNMIRNSTALLQNECVCAHSVTGRCLRTGYWQLIPGCCLPAASLLPLAPGCWRLVAGGLLLAARCWPLAAGWSLLAEVSW